MIILNVSGNVTADAIVKTVNGTTVTSFTIASNSRYKTQSGLFKEDVTFIRCSIWNNPQAASLLYKGRIISTTGIFKLNTWTDSHGDKQTAINLRVSFFQVFGKNSKKEIVTETYTVPASPVTDEQAAAIEKDLPF